MLPKERSSHIRWDYRPGFVALDPRVAGVQDCSQAAREGGPVSAATQASVAHNLPHPRTWPRPEPLELKTLEWGVFALVTFLLISLAVGTPQSVGLGLSKLLIWLPLVVIADLLPVPVFGDLTLALSLPILLAAAMLFAPSAVGLLAFLGSTDSREFRREVTLGRAIFNRSQVALSVTAASFVFHSLNGNPADWPRVLVIAWLALVSDCAVNASLVVLGWRLAGLSSTREALSVLVGGQPIPFLFSYASLGLAALLLAVVFEVGGDWGLLAFAIPVVLARQAFVLSARLREMATAVSDKSRALLSLSERVAEERREERLTVAAGLHDELLPPLYKVHLMGQVLRRDLASGRLLNLEDDLPELVDATEQASEATRELIRGLKDSAIGTGGLIQTLGLLIRDLQSTTATEIGLTAEEVGGSPVVQLLAYQVAREALRNAIRHARAKKVRIMVVPDPPDMRIVIEDDGYGFDPYSVDEEQHFGLRLMRERVELAGGVLHLESTPGRGTRIVVRLPAETSLKEG
jgi:signal transduction histidine kinase